MTVSVTGQSKTTKIRGGEWSSEKFYPSLEISQNLLMGIGVSDFASVGPIFAFLSSHYTFSSRAWILRCQSRRLGESRILPFATPEIVPNSKEISIT